METTVKERILEFISYLGISKNKFEENVGFSKRYVSNIEKSIQPDKIKKISLVYPNLNTGWLLTGDGEMLKNSNIGHTTKGDNSPITGNIEIKQSQYELEKALLKIEYLEKALKDKEEIINLLKQNK